MLQTKICIVGAGPAGAAAALKLSYLGIPSVLIDKATFPRDKICGDAISGKVTTLLNRLDPQILQRFQADAKLQVGVWGIKFVAPNNKYFNVPFQNQYDKVAEAAPGYVSKRINFDNFLIEEVRRRDNIDFYDNTTITGYEKVENGWNITTKDKAMTISCQLLLVADGAHSKFARHHAGLEKINAHHAGAVRAYFKNVEGMHEDNFIELHFIKDITPGYFWIFPLPDGRTNVGLGMRTDYISKRDFNLKKSLFSIIEEHPEVSKRFKHAELEGKVMGYGLPLGSKTRQISGDNYLLLGDAGHLVDPLTGEGIGNGIYSGFIAAELAEKCIADQDFSAAYLKAYDVRVARVLGSEMKLSYQLQRMLKYPWLANTLANWIANNQKLTHIITQMYTDLGLRRQLVNPIWWVKLLWNRGELKEKTA